MGKSTELCWGRNQSSCNEGLSLPEFADSCEQTLQQFPRVKVNASEAQLCGEFAFCKESCKFTLRGPGMALAMGAVRISSLLPWEMGTCRFHRPSGQKYGVLWPGGMGYNIKKLFSVLPAWLCNKPLIRHPASVRGSTAR